MNSILEIKFNLLKISHKISIFGFFLLFPLFFVYHYCVSQNYFPPFLGGLFGNISLLIAVLSTLLLPWMLQNKIEYVRQPIFLFYFSILFFIFWTFYCQFFIQYHPYGDHSFLESYSSFIIWVALFYLGYFLPLEDRYFLFTLKLLCLIIFFIFIYQVIKENSFFALFNLFQNDNEETSLSSYQQAGKSIFISYLLLALCLKNRIVNFLLLILCSIILLSIGSRTDLISMLLAILLYFLHILFKGSNSLKKNFLSFLSFLVLISISIYFSKSFFFASRAAELFDLASSTSWQGRSDLTENAILIIKQNPLLGRFDYYDSPGGYAHNILSSWASFGILGFLLYLYLLFYFLFISIFGYLFKSKYSSFWLLVLVLNFVILSQSLIAVPIFSTLPALVWGLTLNVYAKSKYFKLKSILKLNC